MTEMVARKDPVWRGAAGARFPHAPEARVEGRAVQDEEAVARVQERWQARQVAPDVVLVDANLRSAGHGAPHRGSSRCRRLFHCPRHSLRRIRCRAMISYARSYHSRGQLQREIHPTAAADAVRRLREQLHWGGPAVRTFLAVPLEKTFRQWGLPSEATAWPQDVCGPADSL